MTMSKIGRLMPLVMALVAAAAQAQSGGESAFSFSGFATLGVVSTNSDAGQYAIAGQRRGTYKTASGEVDSKVGVQLTGKANKGFSGKGNPPKELASSAEVRKFFAANPDAIGHLEKSAVDTSLKVVFSVD